MDINKCICGETPTLMTDYDERSGWGDKDKGWLVCRCGLSFDAPTPSSPLPKFSVKQVIDSWNELFSEDNLRILKANEGGVTEEEQEQKESVKFDLWAQLTDRAGVQSFYVVILGEHGYLEDYYGKKEFRVSHSFEDAKQFDSVKEIESLLPAIGYGVYKSNEHGIIEPFKRDLSASTVIGVFTETIREQLQELENYVENIVDKHEAEKAMADRQRVDENLNALLDQPGVDAALDRALEELESGKICYELGDHVKAAAEPLGAQVNGREETIRGRIVGVGHLTNGTIEYTIQDDLTGENKEGYGPLDILRKLD